MPGYAWGSAHLGQTAHPKGTALLVGSEAVLIASGRRSARAQQDLSHATALRAVEWGAAVPIAEVHVGAAGEESSDDLRVVGGDRLVQQRLCCQQLGGCSATATTHSQS
jgi:hypothetical protein